MFLLVNLANYILTSKLILNKTKPRVAPKRRRNPKLSTALITEYSYIFFTVGKTLFEPGEHLMSDNGQTICL